MNNNFSIIGILYSSCFKKKDKKKNHYQKHNKK